jgi:hypothetical protein
MHSASVNNGNLAVSSSWPMLFRFSRLLATMQALIWYSTIVGNSNHHIQLVRFVKYVVTFPETKASKETGLRVSIC